MTHSHSPEAQERRLQRARDKGFLRPRPRDACFVAVPTKIARKVKTVATSLELHASHCMLAGRDIHFAGAAAVAVREQIGENDFRKARAAHSARNRAVHRWADLFEASPGQKGYDELFAKDPWAAALATTSVAHRPPPVVASSPVRAPATSSSSPSPAGGACAGDRVLGVESLQTLSMEL
eukprot:CAMPEP_0195080488 /NCGR_PEP_ID=MMETSP0448-20130528/22178_1 /TAXON_ID=66468 /ORGANISM="Heterocapsa triquestra, Strain CCMP 448" /LENGTH=179 /DNA_ID=CAMNT_0040113441 /DNA_START=9 /DNA_END=544 /DNA_ORIENTATION=+